LAASGGKLDSPRQVRACAPPGAEFRFTINAAGSENAGRRRTGGIASGNEFGNGPGMKYAWERLRAHDALYGGVG
jgi:hypothetical protein